MGVRLYCIAQGSKACSSGISGIVTLRFLSWRTCIYIHIEPIRSQPMAACRHLLSKKRFQCRYIDSVYIHIYIPWTEYIYVIYTLWQTNRAVEKGPLIVFHGNMLVYQRVHEHLGYNPKSNKAKGRRHDRYWG